MELQQKDFIEDGMVRIDVGRGSNGVFNVNKLLDVKGDIEIM